MAAKVESETETPFWMYAVRLDEDPEPPTGFGDDGASVAITTTAATSTTAVLPPTRWR